MVRDLLKSGKVDVNQANKDGAYSSDCYTCTILYEGLSFFVLRLFLYSFMILDVSGHKDGATIYWSILVRSFTFIYVFTYFFYSCGDTSRSSLICESKQGLGGYTSSSK